MLVLVVLFFLPPSGDGSRTVVELSDRNGKQTTLQSPACNFLLLYLAP